MEDNKDSNVESEETGSSRRSFLMKSAVVSAPLVLTALSTPVFADRCGISGIQSGFHESISPEQNQCVQGYSPGWWKENSTRQGAWPDYPLAYCEGANPQSLCFGFPSFNDLETFYAISPDRSAIEILRNDPSSPLTHFIAASLNRREFPSNYALLERDIEKLWSMYQAGTNVKDLMALTWDENDY